MSELRERKTKLERDILGLEHSFQKRTNKVRRTARGAIQPLSYIRKNPVKAVCISVLAGFVLGVAGRRGSSKKHRSSKNANHTSNSKFSSMLFDELKHVAAQKAMKFTSDYIEHKIASSAKADNDVK
ncbi:MAG: hypothetical protein WEA56_09585 [Balneolaceae bacterium]